MVTRNKMVIGRLRFGDCPGNNGRKHIILEALEQQPGGFKKLLGMQVIGHVFQINDGYWFYEDGETMVGPFKTRETAAKVCFWDGVGTIGYPCFAMGNEPKEYAQA